MRGFEVGNTVWDSPRKQGCKVILDWMESLGTWGFWTLFWAWKWEIETVVILWMGFLGLDMGDWNCGNTVVGNSCHGTRVCSSPSFFFVVERTSGLNLLQQN